MRAVLSVIVLSLFALVPTVASAAFGPDLNYKEILEKDTGSGAKSSSRPMSSVVAQASYWTCRAESPVAFGVGVAMRRSVARQIALTECAARTPWNMVCYIQWCERD